MNCIYNMVITWLRLSDEPVVTANYHRGPIERVSPDELPAARNPSFTNEATQASQVIVCL